jgi:hypothetical protein
MASVVGTMDYADFRTRAGILVPHRMTVVDSPENDEVMHEFVVLKARFGVRYAEGYFYPDPLRHGSKH